MNELRIKALQKLSDKICKLQDELQLMFDAELSYVRRYQAAEEVCRNMKKAHKLMTGAVGFLAQARAEAELENVQENMQLDLESLLADR